MNPKHSAHCHPAALRSYIISRCLPQATDGVRGLPHVRTFASALRGCYACMTLRSPHWGMRRACGPISCNAPGARAARRSGIATWRGLFARKAPPLRHGLRSPHSRWLPACRCRCRKVGDSLGVGPLLDASSVSAPAFESDEKLAVAAIAQNAVCIMYAALVLWATKRGENCRRPKTPPHCSYPPHMAMPAETVPLIHVERTAN